MVSTYHSNMNKFLANPPSSSSSSWHSSPSLTDGSTDSRMQHLGCPVLYGDKWIGNKWVRQREQVGRDGNNTVTKLLT